MEGLIHISLGGPMQTIQVNGKRHYFEWHHYCGPIDCDPVTGEPLEEQADDFLEAASYWGQQGKKIEDGLCVWEHPARQEPIVKQVTKRTGVVTGWITIPARKGE